MLRDLYLTNRLFVVLSGVVVLFVAGQFLPVLVPVARLVLVATTVAAGIEVLMLFRTKRGIRGVRDLPRRLSNGDDNVLHVYLENRYGFPVHLTVIDELPFQFQMRGHQVRLRMPSGTERDVRYTVRPTQRGEYRFGALNVYAESPLGLAQRRYRFTEGGAVPVYPSFIQMRTYAFYAVSDRLAEVGVKRVRRVGHTMEFDQIRDYVEGDDYRTINWKATARRSGLMVNQYQDERSQRIYSLIDKGRVMKMPFEGLHLLDYAINASLVVSNIAVQKHDQAGLITFGREVDTIVPAGRSSTQMLRLMEALYNQETAFEESDIAPLHMTVQRRIHQRSLLLLFTNYESRSAMERQLPYLRSLARRHVLVVIFFENTELHARLRTRAGTLEAVYIKTIAEKFAYEKREIVNALRRYGIYAVLTAPEQLTVETINQYLNLKARGVV